MRTDDQHFVPGDKVMQVETPAALGLRCSPESMNLRGKLLCVSRCEFRPWVGWNVTSFVGINDRGHGFYACCFRRVSEIQLCVRAAKRLSEPVETETIETQSA